MATSPPPLNQFSGLAPQRGDSANFSSRMDAFITWFIAAVTQLAAIAFNVYANAAEAFTSALTATSAAATAMAAANATAWVSGTTYGLNVCAISQINFQTYRRSVAGAGTLDPANDPTNWQILTGNGAFLPVVLSSMAVDCSRGNYFTFTLNGNDTLALNKVPAAGFSLTIELTVTSGVLSLPASVTPVGGTFPTLTAGKTHLLMLSTSNSGTRWRLVVGTPFTT